MHDSKEHINWPTYIKVEDYPVHAYNSLFVHTPSEVVWEKLISALDWPRWYKNSSKVKIEGGGNKLNLNTKFTWRTFHVNVKSQVLDFKPYESLGWDAKEFLATGYHGWKLIPKEGGTLIVTEEVQGGFIPKLFSKFIKKSLEREHQKWLEGLTKN